MYSLPLCTAFWPIPGSRAGPKKVRNAFDRWQRLAYTVLALIMTLPFVYILIFLPDRILYSFPAGAG